MNSLTKEIFGKLFADIGYISQKLFEKLLEKDITLVTIAKKNMKNICDIEHTRHRSVTNFLVNLISALAAYSFLPKKPSVSSDSNMPNGSILLYFENRAVFSNNVRFYCNILFFMKSPYQQK